MSYEESYIFNNHQNMGFMYYPKDSIPPREELTLHTELLICCLFKINASTS